MDLGLLILAVLTIGMAIGTIYGSWASDHYWKEHINGHDKANDQSL